MSNTPSTNSARSTTTRLPMYLMGMLLILASISNQRNASVHVTNQTCITLQSPTELGLRMEQQKRTDDDAKVEGVPTRSTTSIQQTHQDTDIDDAKYYSGPETVWERWNYDEQPFPCFEAEPDWRSVGMQRSPADQGLLFTREMKTGSSTVAGVLLNIAHRKGQQALEGGKWCKMRVDHSSARKMQYQNRIRRESFHMSLLRDPTKRAISQYFHFAVSENKQDPTDANFQKYFAKMRQLSNYYVKDLSIDNTLDLRDESQHSEHVRAILNAYDFIAITERMDESLVVMKMLLGLDFEDILYMSAKTNGSFTTAPPPRYCIYIMPSFLSDGMKAFFKSDFWKRFIGADQILYDAAVQSLDNTIDALGRQEVEQQLAIFRKAQEYGQQKCKDRTVYRCNSKGEFMGHRNSTCHLWDIGCGYDCLNEISIEQDIMPLMEQ